jgi:alkylation response protein AidB-like acyl-CoA dehydrogenase
MGLRSSPIGELVFDDVCVPHEAVLGGVGGGSAIFTSSMDWERICLFASHVGAMERLLEASVAYARTRNQFGQAIGKFQAVSHRLADMKVQLEAARLLVYRAAWRLEHARNASLDASIAKLFVSESLVQSALAAVQVHGGYGFMTEYEVERALRDAIGSTLYSGTSEMQRNIIARWLGL